MPRLRIGMRWWLAGVFVLIAVLTAIVVAAVSSRQADTAVRANSEDIAVGKTVTAGFVLERAIANGALADALPLVAARRGLALFVFGRDRKLVTPPVSNGVDWATVPGGREALVEALAGHRYVSSSSGSTVAGLPLRRTDAAAALVSFAPRPAAYGASLSIFRREVVRAALWASLGAAMSGLLAATLIARRLRRIGAAAAAIESGDFDTELRSTFQDEVGSLAQSIDRMRRRLRVAFEQLRAERDRLERLLEQLHEGVLAIDADLSIRFVNRAARRLLELDAAAEGAELPATWWGLRLRELTAGLFRPDAQLAEARVALEAERTIAIVGVPAGASDLAVLVLTDISAQERRERAEREFVANASHELRTPVSAIVGAVEALQAGAKDSPVERDAFLALIGRQADRLGRLTRSLLLLARAQTRQEELELSPVELRPLLDEIAHESGGNGRLVVDCATDVVALAHRDVVEQVISNLVGNALSHAKEGPISIRAREEDDTVVVDVADRGAGIPRDVQQRMFDRFYSGNRGRREGFGLGLAIARDAAHVIGGTIEIRSSDLGTVARVTLATARRR